MATQRERELRRLRVLSDKDDLETKVSDKNRIYLKHFSFNTQHLTVSAPASIGKTRARAPHQRIHGLHLADPFVVWWRRLERPLSNKIRCFIFEDFQNITSAVLVRQKTPTGTNNKHISFIARVERCCARDRHKRHGSQRLLVELARSWVMAAV